MDRKVGRSWLSMLALFGLVALIAAGCGGGGGGGTTSAAEPEGSTSSEEGASESAPVEVAFKSFETGLPNCYSEPKPGNATIAYVSPTAANEVLTYQAEGVKRETERLGGKFVLADGEGEPDKQVAAVQRLLAQGVDAIVIYPLDPAALGPVLKQAQQKGVPVVGVQVNSESEKIPPEFDTQVLLQNGKIGYLEAEAISQLVPAGSELGEIGFAVPVPAIEYILKSAKHYAEEFGLKVVARSNNPTDDIAGGEVAMTQLLGEAPNIAGVISYSDPTAAGAHSVTRAQNKEVAFVSEGGDSVGINSIESGTLGATVQIPMVASGACAARGAFDLIEGQKLPESVKAGEPVLLTPETIDELPTWEEQLDAIAKEGYK